MLVRSSRLSCLLVVAALVPACGSVQQLPEDFVTTEHQETRTQLMIDQAERALNAGDVGMASARIQEIAAGLSSNAHGQLVMARTLIAKGQFLEAGEMLTLLAEAFPDEAEVDIVIGTLAEAPARWEMARVAYGRALEKAPESVSAVLLLARIELVLGLPANAAALLERKLAVLPNVRELQEALGEAYLAGGDYELAAEWYSVALDHDPQVGPLRVRLAFAQSLSGQHLEALRTIREVSETEVPPYVELALARSALIVDEAEEAVFWLDRYLNAFPDDVSAWVDLARAHLLQDGDRASLEALRSALRLDPGRADALLILGHLRMRAGQHQLAMDTYLEALRLGADAAELAPVLEALIQRSGEGGSAERPSGVALQVLSALGGSGGAGS